VLRVRRSIWPRGSAVLPIPPFPLVFPPRLVFTGVRRRLGNVVKILRILVTVGVLALAVRAGGQTLTILHLFTGSVTAPTDGGTPYGGIVQGSDGNFYGTTLLGGTVGFNERNGNGIVYSIDSNGTYSILYEFRGHNADDGAFPEEVELVKGPDGNFYGTTYYGGANDPNGYEIGIGTVFRISPAGVETNLHSFSTYVDGAYPDGGLVLGRDGNFYGSASSGSDPSGMSCCGNVFVMTPSGTLTPLHFFTGTPDGNFPQGALVQGNDGSFYGITFLGGTTNKTAYSKPGYGTVFRVGPDGSYTNLYAFMGPPNDGALPEYGLVLASDGNLYGTTPQGGTYGGGIAFRISSDGTYSNLYSFGASPSDAKYPYASLLQGSDGNLYGTTAGGGTSTNGTIFRMSLAGTLTTLYSFSGNDGAGPNSLRQASDGAFYGTTQSGGAYTNVCPGGCGVAFKFTVQLSPAPNQISSAQVDSTGTNLVFTVPSVAYETYQLQFSPSMNPTNWSNVSGAFVSNSIGAMLTLTNFGGASGPQGFYRFAITP
jgi:uncharacterized repeat protein (TIGR03803 family)